MISPARFYSFLSEHAVHFYTGVPDSLLKSFLSYVQEHAAPEEHVITANEGLAIALAGGYYLRTGKVPLVYLQNQVEAPLKAVESADKYNVVVNATGGGVKGQAEAAKLGIARALIELSAEYRPALKAAGLLKRDPRGVERKKPGKKKARRSYQFSKR